MKRKAGKTSTSERNSSSLRSKRFQRVKSYFLVSGCAKNRASTKKRSRGRGGERKETNPSPLLLFFCARPISWKISFRSLETFATQAKIADAMRISFPAVDQGLNNAHKTSHSAFLLYYCKTTGELKIVVQVD